ncbi:hypothetical protein [Aliiroseovarius marinus]|uniref:hypothetical protein n=1 Tax=Aliiroseovarius marinus TaxID=2500159 RepID=UPI003D7EEDB4
MIDVRPNHENGYLYLLVSEPFSLDELYQLLLNSPNAFVGWPAVLDLRQVRLDRITETDIRRHLMKKSSLGGAKTSVPCAYVVEGVKAQAVVRMATVMSELASISKDEDMLVTEDLEEATRWVTASGAAVDAKRRYSRG